MLTALVILLVWVSTGDAGPHWRSRHHHTEQLATQRTEEDSQKKKGKNGAQGVERIVEPGTEPVTKPVVEPVVEVITESTVQPIMEPIVGGVSEPIIEPIPEPVPEPIPSPIPTGVSANHASVATTIFWVGEAAGPDNGGISNADSAWDWEWEENFGGVDDPERRNGYLPAGFTPKENVFYCALPYNDISTEGERKVSAINSPLYATLKHTPYSWCKNAWVAIYHDGKTAYAQWEDVGPFHEDDVDYVFGDSPPANGQGAAAGLDVSPAVRDFLGLNDVDRCSWRFVSADAVPSGPWTQVITTEPGESIPY